MLFVSFSHDMIRPGCGALRAGGQAIAPRVGKAPKLRCLRVNRPEYNTPLLRLSATFSRGLTPIPAHYHIRYFTRTYANMASATSFYEFTPKDSMFCLHSQHDLLQTLRSRIEEHIGPVYTLPFPRCVARFILLSTYTFTNAFNREGQPLPSIQPQQ